MEILEYQSVRNPISGNYYAYISHDDGLGYLFMHVSIEHNGKVGPFVTTSTVPEPLVRLYAAPPNANIIVVQHILYENTLCEIPVGSASVNELDSLPKSMLHDLIFGLVIGHYEQFDLSFSDIEEVYSFIRKSCPFQPEVVDLSSNKNEGEDNDDS